MVEGVEALPEASNHLEHVLTVESKIDSSGKASSIIGSGSTYTLVRTHVDGERSYVENSTDIKIEDRRETRSTFAGKEKGTPHEERMETDTTVFYDVFANKDTLILE